MEFANSALDPMDSAFIPFLKAEEFERQMSLLSAEFDCGPVQQIRTGVLKIHPDRRCAFEISLRTGDVSRELMGKVYKKDRPGVFEIMAAIREAGFGDDAEFSIPRPLAYISSLRLLVVTKAKGLHTAQVFLEGDTRERELAAVRSALWLARFHALAGIPGEVLTSERMYRQSFKMSEQLSECCPSLAAKSQQLLEALEPGRRSLIDIPTVPGHGDFVPAHVFLTDRQVVTVDWDSFTLCDPSRDVARFMLGLRRLAERHLGSIRALDACATLFLETYLAEGNRNVAQNLSFFSAALCLRQAKRFVHRQRSRWQERAEALLDEGLHALSDR